MSRVPRFSAAFGLTIAVCIFGFGAGITPSTVYSSPFWGVQVFMDKEPFQSGDLDGVIVTAVESDSPVAMAGIRTRDRVLRLNDSPVEFGNFSRLMRQIQPGEAVTIEILRDEQNMQLSYKAEEPYLMAVIFYDWQFISAPVFLLLLTLFIATQPLNPTLWRAIVTIVSGLAVLVSTVVIEATSFIPWTAVWRSRSIDNPPSPLIHLTLMLITLLASLSTLILGAFAVRTVLLRWRSERKQAEQPAMES